MSFTKETVLWCQECGNWKRFTTNQVSVARKKAKTLGWAYIRHYGDMCPNCVDTIKSEPSVDNTIWDHETVAYNQKELIEAPVH